MRLLPKKLVNLNELIDSRYQERDKLDLDSFVNDIVSRKTSVENIPAICYIVNTKGMKEIVDGHRRVQTFREIVKRYGDTNYSAIYAEEMVDYTEIDVYEKHIDANKSQPLSVKEKERVIILGFNSGLFKTQSDYVRYLGGRNQKMSEAELSKKLKCYYYREFCRRIMNGSVNIPRINTIDVIENMSVGVLSEVLTKFPDSGSLVEFEKNIVEMRIFVNIVNKLNGEHGQKQLRNYMSIVFDAFKNLDDISYRQIKFLLALRFSPDTINVISDNSVLINYVNLNNVVRNKFIYYLKTDTKDFDKLRYRIERFSKFLEIEFKETNGYNISSLPDDNDINILNEAAKKMTASDIKDVVEKAEDDLISLMNGKQEGVQVLQTRYGEVTLDYVMDRYARYKRACLLILSKSIRGYKNGLSSLYNLYKENPNITSNDLVNSDDDLMSRIFIDANDRLVEEKETAKKTIEMNNMIGLNGTE